MTYRVDHVVVCVPSLAHNPFDLEAVEGGEHEGIGTANRIIPLGDSYIELVTVIDPEVASRAEFGRWVGARSQIDGADALCLRGTDLVDSIPMSRRLPDGSQLAWELAGLQSAIEMKAPFFIEWGDMSRHPGRSEINGGSRLDSLTFSGDRARLEALTGEVPGLAYVDGPFEISFTVARS